LLAPSEGGVIFDACDLESARLLLETSWGEVEALGSGRLVRTGETGLEGEARMEVTSGIVRGRAALSGASNADAVNGELVLELAASGTFGAGSLGAASLSVEADVRGRSDAWEIAFRKCADLRIDGLAFERILAFASPLHACLGKPEQRLLTVVASEAGASQLDGSLEIPPLRLGLELGTRATAAEGESPTLGWTLSGSADAPTLTLASRGGLLAIPEPGFELHGLEGSLAWSRGAGLEGRARVEEILDVSEGRGLPRLGLDLEARREAGGVAFALRLSDDSRLFVLRLGGRTSVGEPLRAELQLEPVSLSHEGVELLRLLPGLGDVEGSGTLAALGSLEWGEGGLAGSVDLALRDLDLASSLAQVELANGVVRLEGPSPLSIPPGQLLSVARLDLGLELFDGIARFGVSPEGAVSVEESEWLFAGGDAMARGSLDPEAGAPLVLAVEGADPAELFALLDLAGLEGEGSLSGELTLARAEGGLVIESGRLVSDGGGGWIRYTPVAGQPEEVRAALAPRAEALANFRYDELALELSGQVPGPVDVLVTLVGANPDLGDASPIELRFDVPGVLEPRPEVTVPEAVIPPEVVEALDAFEARRGSAADR
jgi:hypothetical protein